MFTAPKGQHMQTHFHLMKGFLKTHVFYCRITILYHIIFQLFIPFPAPTDENDLKCTSCSTYVNSVFFIEYLLAFTKLGGFIWILMHRQDYYRKILMLIKIKFIDSFNTRLSWNLPIDISGNPQFVLFSVVVVVVAVF